jgi:hypothetical protein
MTATRRLAAILAADVAGYSRLMGADEEGTHESSDLPRPGTGGQQALPVCPRASGHACRTIPSSGERSISGSDSPDFSNFLIDR